MEANYSYTQSKPVISFQQKLNMLDGKDGTKPILQTGVLKCICL